MKLQYRLQPIAEHWPDKKKCSILNKRLYRATNRVRLNENLWKTQLYTIYTRDRWGNVENIIFFLFYPLKMFGFFCVFPRFSNVRDFLWKHMYNCWTNFLIWCYAFDLKLKLFFFYSNYRRYRAKRIRIIEFIIENQLTQLRLRS